MSKNKTVYIENNILTDPAVSEDRTVNRFVFGGQYSSGALADDLNWTHVHGILHSEHHLLTTSWRQEVNRVSSASPKEVCIWTTRSEAS